MKVVRMVEVLKMARGRIGGVKSGCNWVVAMKVF